MTGPDWGCACRYAPIFICLGIAMNVVQLIRSKRDGHALTDADINALIMAYTDGSVPDYQMAAFLMAAFKSGMTTAEMVALTHSMLYSGVVLDLSDLPGIKVDKHSTGGVGDKISIPLAAIVSACGVPVPMISGRGLGHTGGTLDKLESIPGFSTSMDIASYRRQLRELGVVMIGQTDDIAPADKKLYALRDVTATVEFIPFIAASIMSKKLAEGIDALVLDVKFGSGAFMAEEHDARRLAETMVRLGEEFGTRTVALLTRMDTPLGAAIGNWVEVAESIRVLRGEGPADVTALTLALAAEMLVLGGVASDAGQARLLAEEAVATGKALRRFEDLVDAQHGDVNVVRNPDSRPGAAPLAQIRVPDNAGRFVTAIDARKVGLACVELGAGRARKEDDVDPVAGFTLLKKPGDPIRPGEVLARVHTSSRDRAEKAGSDLLAAFAFGNAAPAVKELIVDRLDVGGWGRR